MKTFEQFEISPNEMNSIEGGTFFWGFSFSYNFCAPKIVNCIPKTTCVPTCPPPPTTCTPPKTCTPPPTGCLPAGGTSGN